MKFCPDCGKPLETGEVAGRTRARCVAPDCGFVHWNNPVPVVAAIVELDGSVVLARKRGWPRKMFGLVTGFLERGETPEESVLREVGEELGLHGRIAGFVGYYPFHPRNELLLVFHIEVEGEPVVGEELAEVKRVPVAKLRPWSIGTGPAVRDWLERREAVDSRPENRP